MKKVCAWCTAEMEAASSASEEVTHGICPPCAARFFSDGHEASELGAFLDSFDIPVAAVDCSMRVLTVNERARQLFGESLAPLAGARPGEVFTCSYSLLPEGCGETIHCSGCTIRASLVETYQSGQAQIMVPAYLHKGDSRVRLFITTEKVADAVLLRIDALADDDPTP
jgi:PAS domain-containing protein